MQRFLAAEWRKLIMANYAVDASILKPLLPAGTETDNWNGAACVSLVGFMFNNTRVRGIKIPFHINFPEVNLRFYVRYKENSEWKRGVVFVREIVPRPAITFVANNLFQEKYITLPMRHSIVGDDKLQVSYQWKFKNTWYSIEAQTSGEKQPILTGSEEQFITDQSWGYSALSKTSIGEYRVDHPRWEVYPLQSYNIQCDFEILYGKMFAELNGQTPRSVFLAEGSPVSVYKRRIISVTSS